MAIPKKSVQILMDLYQGDSVILYLKGMNVLIAHEESGQMDITAMLTGIVMDIDEAFIHLGDGNMVTKSIYHENVGLIETTTVEEMLITPELATNDTEIN
jgi:hypothetical protein